MTTLLTKRQKFFKRLRWYAIGGGSVLLCVLATALLVRSPLFAIDEIQVVGVPNELKKAIENDLTVTVLKIPRSALLSPKSYFAWPKNFPYAAFAASSVVLEKNLWGKEVVFHVTPRERYAIWCQKTKGEQEQCFWLDALGTAFAEAPLGEGQLVRTIFSNDGGTASVGASVVDQKTFAIIKKIIDGTKELPVSFQKFEYSDSLAELHLITSQGTVVRLSTRFDPNTTALPALRRLINKPGLDKLNYVNLTVENRAYLKYR